MKKYKIKKIKKKILLPQNTYFFNLEIYKLKKQGTWQKFSLKMKKEFLDPKNWIVKEKIIKKGINNKIVKFLSFTKLKKYKASIKGTEKLKQLRTIEGLNKLVLEYHNKFEKYKNSMTITQEKELRKLKNTLLWTQLQNAKTAQRKETLRQQIKLFKENDLGVLFNNTTNTRIDFTTFITTYKPEIFEKYYDYFKYYTGREGTIDEILSIFKDEIIAELNLESAKKGKKDFQYDVYWDDSTNSIIYLDVY